ncbi:hypothetical protein RMO59_42155, partial [Streptomyces alfalfae]
YPFFSLCWPLVLRGQCLSPPCAPAPPARSAIFVVTDRGALVTRGAGTCVATVINGKLVYRAR